MPSRRALVSSKALQDFAAANLKDEFREVHPICFSCSDRGVVHANQPVRTIEDIKDMKLHVPTRFAGDAMRVLGAQPVPMPNAQLPLAITGHVVDGCVDPWHLVPTLPSQRSAEDAYRIFRFIAEQHDVRAGDEPGRSTIGCRAN